MGSCAEVPSVMHKWTLRGWRKRNTEAVVHEMREGLAHMPAFSLASAFEWSAVGVFQQNGGGALFQISTAPPAAIALADHNLLLLSWLEVPKCAPLVCSQG